MGENSIRPLVCVTNSKDPEKITSVKSIEKRSIESLLEITNASGALLPCFMDIIFLTVLAAVMVTPILFIPINDPAEGFWKNLTYWFGYNPYVGTIYTLASYTRLSHICTRSQELADVCGKPKMESNWGFNCQSLMMFIASSFAQTGIMALIGWAHDTTVGSSYMMLYSAPIACTVSDVLFIFLLPKEERTGGVAGMLRDYSGMCGVPIFVIFVPIIVKVFLPPMCAAIIPVFIFPLLSRLLASKVEGALLKLMEENHFDCSWMDSGVPIHLEAMICIGEMMLFPGSETIGVLCAIVGSNLMQRMYDLKQLDVPTRDCVGQESPNYQQLSAEALAQSPDEIGSRRRRIAFIFTSDDGKQQAKTRSSELTIEALKQRSDMGITQLTTISCPLLFVVLTYVITNYKNREQYYVYECLEGPQEMVAITFAIIALIFQLGFFTIDIAVLYYHYTADTFLLMFQTFLHGRRLLICSTLAFATAIFTSCFMIKHDGIVVLEHLIQSCDLEAIRTS